MKKGIHPEYGRVAFRDVSTGKVFVTRSTAVQRPARAWVDVDGEEVPLIDVDITSDSHPLWTGRTRVLDTEGRVEAFERRYGAGR
ncbi:MAG: type B 50S ribosomal protein L31 [Actinomycetales bacterium]|jgi:large subunit ribosomal protein L31|nr:type B 50S ribosomal protein L31 [Actinomycetales bacterium]